MRVYLIIPFILLSTVLVSTCGCSHKKPSVESFAGRYEGTYEGAASGSWRAIFSKSGEVTADISDSQIGELTGFGIIKPSGEFSLNTKGNVVDKLSTITWSGSFKIDPQNDSIGVGTWEAALEYKGTWQGKRVAKY